MMTCLLASDLADVDAEAEPEAVAPAGTPVLIVEDRVSLWLGPNSTKINTKIGDLRSRCTGVQSQ